MKLDRIDARIIAALQRDGRRSVVDLAAEIGLSPTPCARRIRLLEERGVIQGYAAIIDPKRLGLNAQAFVQVKLERHSDEMAAAFRRAVVEMEEVISCYSTTGEHDFLLQVATADLEALSAFVMRKLLKTPGVRDVHSSVVLETVKRSIRLPVAQLA